MSKEELAAEIEAAEEEVEAGDAGAGNGRTTTEEIKVQAEDLFRAINDLIREGTARRITVLRNDRVLLDIPLIAGLPLGAILAIQLPVLSAVVGVPSTNAFSGPWMTVSNRSPLPERVTRTPPSLIFSSLDRVVYSRNVPWVPSRSGTHMALSWAP